MKYSIVVTCVLILAGSDVSPANQWVTADPGFYVSGHVGPVFVPNLTTTDSEAPGVRARTKVEDGIGLLGALGYDFGTIRTEGEVGYQTSKLDKVVVGSDKTTLTGHLNATTFMANACLDFRGKNVPLVPYLTAGIGMADVAADGVRVPGSGLPAVDESDDVIAWQIGFGVGWLIDSHWTFDVLYRYFATADAEFGTTEMEFASHNIYLGVRYKF
jgi:opacity protein-like surface antigen